MQETTRRRIVIVLAFLLGAGVMGVADRYCRGKCVGIFVPASPQDVVYRVFENGRVEVSNLSQTGWTPWWTVGK